MTTNAASAWTPGSRDERCRSVQAITRRHARAGPCRTYPQRPRGATGIHTRDGVAGSAALPSLHQPCLLYTSDAADDLLCVDLGGRRIIKKKKKKKTKK